MPSIKFSNYLQIINPEYVYLKLTPNNSILNNFTHKIAKAINSLHKNILQNIKKERFKLVKFLGLKYFVLPYIKECELPTKWSFRVPTKVSFYVYMEKQRIDFYFIVPRHHLSIIKEKINDVWTNITVNEVETIPEFGEWATKYYLVYTKEDGLSLAVDRRTNELLESNLNIVDVMEEGDKAGIFYNFMPTSQNTWRSIYRLTIKKVSKGMPERL